MNDNRLAAAAVAIQSNPDTHIHIIQLKQVVVGLNEWPPLLPTRDQSLRPIARVSALSCLTFYPPPPAPYIHICWVGSFLPAGCVAHLPASFDRNSFSQA